MVLKFDEPFSLLVNLKNPVMKKISWVKNCAYLASVTHLHYRRANNFVEGCGYLPDIVLKI